MCKHGGEWSKLRSVGEELRIVKAFAAQEALGLLKSLGQRLRPFLLSREREFKNVLTLGRDARGLLRGPARVKIVGSPFGGMQ